MQASHIFCFTSKPFVVVPSLHLDLLEDDRPPKNLCEFLVFVCSVFKEDPDNALDVVKRLRQATVDLLQKLAKWQHQQKQPDDYA